MNFPRGVWERAALAALVVEVAVVIAAEGGDGATAFERGGGETGLDLRACSTLRHLRGADLDVAAGLRFCGAGDMRAPIGVRRVSFR